MTERPSRAQCTFRGLIWLIGLSLAIKDQSYLEIHVIVMKFSICPFADKISRGSNSELMNFMNLMNFEAGF
jgi:hypothetical protein